jgi:hypothetical protein
MVYDILKKSLIEKHLNELVNNKNLTKTSTFIFKIQSLNEFK